jgi:hypothetical protein
MSLMEPLCRAHPATSNRPTLALLPRGYTSHEHMDKLGLIHNFICQELSWIP